MTEYHVRSIEPWGFHGTNEELTSIGVRTSIGHGEYARTSMLELEVLIRKTIAIDRHSTGTIVVGEVATLQHELRNHTVKGRTFVTVPLLPCTKRTEILSSLWRYISS